MIREGYCPVTRRGLIRLAAPAVLAAGMLPGVARAEGKRLAYLTPGLDLPFWRILSKGIEAEAKRNGAVATTYDSHNSAQTQLQNAQDAIAKRVDGLIISPTDSSTAPSVLALAKRAGIPVVIADIGTTGGEYVSFIISDNEQGAYGTGQALARAMKAKGWEKGTVGLVTISLARKNGQARTNGFKKALAEAGIRDVALSQMQTYTADETFKFVQDMLTAHPDMRGLFVETDQPAIGALRALKAARRDKDVLLAAFDGIPDFIPLIESGQIVASGMQQPYLMGENAARSMFAHFAGKTPEKTITVPILVVDQENVRKLEPTVRETVFGEA